MQKLPQRNYYILLSILMLSCTRGNVIDNNSATNMHFKDWLNLPCDQSLCCGTYQEPIYPTNSSTLHNNKSLITIKADSSNLSDITADFSGNVIATQDKSSMTSKRLLIEKNRDGVIEKIIADGDVVMTDPGIRIEGTKAIDYNTQQKKLIYQNQFRLYKEHARGKSQLLTLEGKDILLLNNATYTTCGPLHNTWEIYADKLKLSKITGRGEAWGARLHLHGIPVLYTPYINFPLDERRKTGLLAPKIENSKTSGQSLILPIYFNLAPNYDATVTPNFITKRGILLENEFRYINIKTNSLANFDFIPHDAAYSKYKQDRRANHPNISAQDPKLTALNHRENSRYHIAWFLHEKFNDNWLLWLNYNKVSDSNYFFDFKDLKEASLYPMLYPEQKIGLSYQNSLGYASAIMQHHQILHPYELGATKEQYNLMPQISLNSRELYFYDSQFYNKTSTNLTHYNVREHEKINFTTGYRYQLRHTLGYDIIKPYMFIKPKLKLNFLKYNTAPSIASKNYLRNNSALVIPIFDLHSGLIFERKLLLQKQLYWHTLEPEFYYLYVPYKDQTKMPLFDTVKSGFNYSSLSRDNRYSGFDRIGDTNQLSLSITNRFIDIYGNDKVRLSIGQILYFHKLMAQIKDEVPYTHRTSPIATELVYYLTPNWSVFSNITHKRRYINSTSIGVNYNKDNNVFNTNYQVDHYRGNYTIKQIDANTTFEVNNNWRFYAGLIYDIKLHRHDTIDTGFEYQGCCFVTRFIASRALLKNNIYLNTDKKYQTKFSLQLVLKGLTAIGNFSNKFSGYRPQNNRY